MNKIFQDKKVKGIEVYIDDLVIHTQSERQHDELVRETLKRLEENNMTVNQEKIQWKKHEVKLLGVAINGIEQESNEIKRNEALEYPAPTNVTKLRRFLEMTGWFSNFIERYAMKTVNLTEGLKGKGKKWKWTGDMEKEFKELKEELRNLKKLLLASRLQ